MAVKVKHPSAMEYTNHNRDTLMLDFNYVCIYLILFQDKT